MTATITAVWEIGVREMESRLVMGVGNEPSDVHIPSRSSYYVKSSNSSEHT